MAKEKAEHNGPDLAQGIALSAFTSETLLGHVDDQDVLLVRFGPEIFARGRREYPLPLASRLF